MFRLLYKYQRVIVIVVGVTICLSFCLYAPSGGPPEKEEKEFTKGYNGNPLMQKEMSVFSDFMLSDGEDSRKGCLLHGFLVKRGLFSSGLAYTMGLRYWDALKGEIEECLAQVGEFVPYVHPGHKELSVENVYKQYHAPYYQLYQRVKDTSLPVKERFKLLCEMYGVSDRVTEDMVRYMLRMQEQASGMRQKDLMLNQANVTLVGCKRFDQWFGKKMRSLVSQVYLNGVEKAKEAGIEVRDGLTEELLRLHLEKFLFRDKELTKEEVEKVDSVYASVIKQYHHADRDVKVAMRKAVAFHKYLEKTEDAIFIDPLMNKEFIQVAGQKRYVNRHMLPQCLKVESKEDLALLAHYLLLTSAKLEGSIPQRLLAKKEEIHPRLQAKKFEVMIRGVHHLEAVNAIGMKRLMEWEVAQFNEIKKQSIILKSGKSETDAEKIQLLTNLPLEQKAHIDSYAAKKILKEDRSIIEGLFRNKTSQEKIITVTMDGSVCDLPGIKQGKKLLKLLENKDKKLLCYEGNGPVTYSIEVKNSGKEVVLPFVEAKKMGVLSLAMKERLQRRYICLKRDKSPVVHSATNILKPFSEVMDSLMDLEYVAFFKECKKGVESIFGALPEGKNWWSFALGPYVQECLSLEKEGKLAHFSTEIAALDFIPWEKQWLMAKQTEVYIRSEIPNFYPEQEFLQMDAQTYSPLCVSVKDELSFFFLDKIEQGTQADELVQSLKEASLLSVPTKEKRFVSFLEELDQQKALVWKK